jgi:hypothetical protein
MQPELVRPTAINFGYDVDHVIVNVDHRRAGNADFRLNARSISAVNRGLS